MSIQEKHYSVDVGTLSVLSAGNPDNQRVLLLHGIPANAYLFRDVLPLLADAGYYVLAPHMPGYGSTRLSHTADYSLSAVADLYANWLESENLAPVHLVGHDLGGALAQLLAVRYPHLISHLTLGNAPIGDSFPVFSVNLAILAVKLGIFPLLASIGLIPNPYMNHELQRGFADASKITQSMWDMIFWDSKINSRDGIAEFAKHLKHLRNDESIAIVPELANISVPTLVLWSDTDRHQPAESTGQRLLNALPANTAYEVIAGAGHFMPIETPEKYAHAITWWRASLSVSS